MEVCFKGMQMRRGNLQSCRTQWRDIKQGWCGSQRGKDVRGGWRERGEEPLSVCSIDTPVPILFFFLFFSVHLTLAVFPHKAKTATLLI